MSNSVIRKLQLRKQNEGIWTKKTLLQIYFAFPSLVTPLFKVSAHSDSNNSHEYLCKLD